MSNSKLIDCSNYLTIVALEDGLTVNFSNFGEYCVDGDGSWKTLNINTNTESINTGQKLSFRGNLTPNSRNGIGTFTISKNCNLEGNCMSMLFGDYAESIPSLLNKNYAFYRLFNNCTGLKSVSSNFLPATVLGLNCYHSMFYGCSSLTTAPVLPSTTLALSCYNSMFYGCSSLTTAPELPATTLAAGCYNYMFCGCSKLNYIKMLATDISAEGCLSGWVQGVSPTGTFVKNKNATWNVTGVDGVPSGWTIQKV